MACMAPVSLRSKPIAQPAKPQADPARRRKRAGKADVPFWKQEIFESNRFSLKELAAFTVELASLTNSGQPLDAAFRIIAGPGAAAKTVRLANGLLKDVLSGMQLSEAMAQRPEIFPSDYRAILSAGEAGGVTGQVLKQISELLARRLEIRSKVTAALVYPAILILMSMVSVMRHRVRPCSQHCSDLHRCRSSASRHSEYVGGDAGQLAGGDIDTGVWRHGRAPGYGAGSGTMPT